MGETRRYLGVAETARLMRKALKDAFPSTKFSVRSSSYAGGASIRVRWCDGPSTKRVEAISGQYQGAGFDGSIDMKYHVEHWLLPDGSTVPASSPGTQGSMGYVPSIKNNRPHDDAELVSFGADYVFEERVTSLEFARKAAAQVAQFYGVEAPELKAGDYNLWTFADEKMRDKQASGEEGWFGPHGTWGECIRRAMEDATAFSREVTA